MGWTASGMTASRPEGRSSRVAARACGTGLTAFLHGGRNLLHGVGQPGISRSSRDALDQRSITRVSRRQVVFSYVRADLLCSPPKFLRVFYYLLALLRLSFILLNASVGRLSSKTSDFSIRTTISK